MPLRKTREQREAKRAEMDRLDREASARQVALTDAARSRPPLFCQACDAALAPSAVRCDHCGSDDLALTMPPCPLFSEAVPSGICPRCQGTSFHKPTSAGAFAASGMRISVRLERPWAPRSGRSGHRSSFSATTAGLDSAVVSGS